MKILDRLRTRGLPPYVELADWSFGTIAAFQKLQDGGFRGAVFVGGIARGRPPGTLHRFRPSPEPPPAAEAHARVADSVMGLVCLDNLIMLAGLYDALPPSVLQVEVEPVDETWGSDLSAPVAALLEPAERMIVAELRRCMLLPPRSEPAPRRAARPPVE